MTTIKEALDILKHLAANAQMDFANRQKAIEAVLVIESALPKEDSVKTGLAL